MKHLLLIAILVACGGKQSDDGLAQAEPKSSKPTPADQKPTPTKPSSTKLPMITFKPTLKFREYAATILAVPAADIQGGAEDAADAASKPQSVGGVWAYAVAGKDNPQREIRGWATADGTIVTGEQHLGLLLAEVGVWTNGRKETDAELARRLAELLTWSYGYGFTFIKNRDLGMAPPMMTLKPDGSGELVFFTDYKAAGPGGAGGGPANWVEHHVAFKADKSATLTKTKK